MAADPGSARTGPDDPACRGEPEQHAGRHPEGALPALPLAERDLLPEAGDLGRELGRGGLAAELERAQRLGLELGEPALGIGREPGAGDHLDGRPSLLGRVVAGARREDDRDELDRLDEHRPAHPEDPDERAILVQHAADRLRLGAGITGRHPGDDGQVDRRRIAAWSPTRDVAASTGPGARAPAVRWWRRASRARRSGTSMRRIRPRYPRSTDRRSGPSAVAAPASLGAATRAGAGRCGAARTAPRTRGRGRRRGRSTGGSSSRA